MGLIYTYPTCVTPVSNESRTERVSIILATCYDTLGFNNEPKCNECYCQPYIEGDTFYFQIALSSSQLLVDVELYGTDGTLLNTVSLDNTTYWNEFGVQSNVKFDMDAIRAAAGVDCFRVKLNYADSSFTSEPFCLVTCDKSTVLICSEYSNQDCNNRVYSFTNDYYTFPLPAVALSNCIRVYGEVEFISTGTEIIYNDINTSISSRSIQTQSNLSNQFDLRIWGDRGGIPEWTVNVLQAILGGSNFTVDGVSYRVSGGMSKNNKGSSMWFPSIKLEQECKVFNRKC